MKRLSILLCLLFINGIFLFAQESAAEPDATESPEIQEPQEELPPEEDADSPMPEADDYYTDDEEFVYKMNQKGDQFIKLGLMVDIPLRPAIPQLGVGFSGTLGYMRFLTGNFAVGGDASFAYMPTIGENTITLIPLMARVMYQFAFHKFEVPIMLGIGGAFESYVGDMYFGLIIKPEIGFFYRHSPSWSVGLTAGCSLMPQWANSEKGPWWKVTSSYFGVIMDAGVTVRYHF